MKQLEILNLNAYKNLGRLSYISLGLFPFLKESFGSICIICCFIFVLVDFYKNHKDLQLGSTFWILSSVFWIFLVFQIITLRFDLKITLRNLPFVFIPLIFRFIPNYVSRSDLKWIVKCFQLSVVILFFFNLAMFLKGHTIFSLFEISPENIPLFRNFVYKNGVNQLHPTYFGYFALLSYSISFYKLVYDYEGKVYRNGHFVNTIICASIIFILVSKVILILWLLTTIILVAFLLKTKVKKFKAWRLAIVIFGFVVLSFPFKTMIQGRINEIRTEINRPISGDYFNSINIRVAILKCSVKLVKHTPFFGYGPNQQDYLNLCYADNYNSDFYEIQTYNSHNYFIYLLLYGGWLMLILFLVFFGMLFKTLKTNFLSTLFLVQILIVNLTENFLYRHYGIITFVLFSTIFAYFEILDEKKGNNALSV
ncbi:O-antigen ligase family protein [Aegicerativicinus sediminis]|uniref:O-antigen ligase family protein n=1 Tax=Aegicerativicinus sediminis TaxID=2893202 RepID=UPI001E4152DA|nr:O-antigen ligase family protein [Aegicerativicinus sediminis]